MAGHDSPDDSVASFCVFTGFIDEKIERYLWHLEDEPKKDVAESLIGDFSWQELEFARVKLFENASPFENGARIEGLNVERQWGITSDEKTITNPWILKKRRAITKTALDLCDIYLFLTGRMKGFPTGMIKRKAMGPYEKYKAIVSKQLEPIIERRVFIDDEEVETPPEAPTSMDTGSSIETEGDERPVPSPCADLIQQEECIGEDMDFSNILDDDECDPGFWVIHPCTVPDNVTCVDRSMTNWRKEEEKMAVGKKESISGKGEEKSFILFEELCETVEVRGVVDLPTCKSQGTANDTMNGTTHPCDHTMHEELTRAVTAKPIGPGEFFAVTVPKKVTAEKTTVSPVKSVVGNEDATEDISQSSFLKELDELHERIILSVQKLPNAKVPDKPKKVTMATQTEPNVIPDLPVLKSEFDSQMETVERSLTDHERRMRSSEMWRSKNEKKVDRIDAEYHNQMKIVCASNSEMVSDIKFLKKAVKDMGEKLDKCVCAGCKGRSPCSGDETPSKKRIRRESGYQRSSCRGKGRVVSTPVRKDELLKKKNGARKSEGIYKSLMRVARNVISPRSNLRHMSIVSSQSVDVVEVASPSVPEKSVSALDLRMCPGPEDKDIQRNTAGGSHITSTPMPGQAGENVVELSWADEDNEDSRAIVSYLSEMEKNDGCDDIVHTEDDQSKQTGVENGRMADVEKDKPIVEKAPVGHPVRGGADYTRQTSVAESVKMRVASAWGGAPKKQNIENSEPVTPASEGMGEKTDDGTKSKQRAVANGSTRNEVINGGGKQKVPAWGKPNELVMTDNAGPPTPKRSPTLVKVVGKNGWSTMMRKNGKYPPLQAGHMRPKKDIFVRGLAATIYGSKEEMEAAVRDYCEERGIGVFYISIMPIQMGSDVANCKIGVAEEDLAQVMEDGFWPSKVLVREWFYNPKDKPNNPNQQDRNNNLQ